MSVRDKCVLVPSEFCVNPIWAQLPYAGVCGIKEGKWLTASVLCEDFAAYLKTHAYTHMNRRDIIFFSEDNFLITRCRSTNDSNLQGELSVAFAGGWMQKITPKTNKTTHDVVRLDKEKQKKKLWKEESEPGNLERGIKSDVSIDKIQDFPPQPKG
ncbi:hypothetical protein RUM44_012146 [Polyplax serrata]|uniref:Uncharacterized protein n=1 Tax=Polyplax serrata TaxID=468196 RepID=A0ABR1BEQ2_POLSC